jgi:site-specific DNA-cytosine methylase
MTGKNHGSCDNWPTASVCGNHNRKGASENSGDGLSTAVKSWATPSSGGSTGGPTGLAGGSGNRAKMRRIFGSEVNSKLNPRWVCQLMGVPTDWVYPSESERNRTDELRMLGNGVVPQTAAKAFLTLTTNIIQPKKI